MAKPPHLCVVYGWFYNIGAELSSVTDKIFTISPLRKKLCCPCHRQRRAIGEF